MGIITASFPSVNVRRGGSSTPRRAGARSLLAVACAASLLLFNSACYSYRRVEPTALAGGQRVEVALTDAARVRLGEQFGGSVASVRGLVVGREASGYTIAVDRLRYVSGATSRWSGETVSIAAPDVAIVQERRMSAVRTALLAGVGVGALVFLTLGMDWIGFGSDDDRNPGRDPTNPDQ
jgi:hypothetical protein